MPLFVRKLLEPILAILRLSQRDHARSASRSDLTEFRKAKDEFFGTNHQSPLTDQQQSNFPGLSYFDEDGGFRYEVEVEEFDEKELIEMQTSTGAVASYTRWGKVAFDVEGETAELTLFGDAHGHGGEFFVPFADVTTGTETYDAGRYLDIQPLPGGKMLVDFNIAYNPYCAYNEQWSCPLTPFENRLKVSIRAGEKNFK